MEYVKTCNHCGGTGKITRELKVGDIIQPTDGSSMPNALHKILWNGHGVPSCDLPLGAEKAFKPVRVLSIEGSLIAVVPVHWDDREIRHKEMFDKEIYPALSYIYEGKGKYVSDYGFWINVYVTKPR